MFILKQLRRKKNINQSDLAEVIGVSLRTIQLYEKKDANIPIKNLTKIAKYFDVSIADLYSHESFNETGAVYKDFGKKLDKIHTIYKLGPGKYLLSVPLVLVEEYDNYIRQNFDSSYVQSLPQISFTVDQVSVSQYIAFEISNDSMDDGTMGRIPKKAIVLGKLYPMSKLRKSLKEQLHQDCIIVHNDSIMCKKIISYNSDNKSLSCHSLNKSPEYLDFYVPEDEILQTFKIIRKQME